MSHGLVARFAHSFQHIESAVRVDLEIFCGAKNRCGNRDLRRQVENEVGARDSLQQSERIVAHIAHYEFTVVRKFLAQITQIEALCPCGRGYRRR